MSEDTPKPPRHRVARPDELTKDTFEFIDAVDRFKRTHMISIVSNSQVLEILRGLGYEFDVGKRDELTVYEASVAAYKAQHSRLFPNWSEIFEIVTELGYTRSGRVA
ncbi:MAG: hypothetical protein ACI8TQ_000465 [Planctomycetota bacterium]|jgi:hypothetical protein